MGTYVPFSLAPHLTDVWKSKGYLIYLNCAITPLTRA